jgi:hypothetical protein
MSHDEFELQRCSRKRLANRFFIILVSLASLLLFMAFVAATVRL